MSDLYEFEEDGVVKFSWIKKKGLQPRSEGGQYMTTKGLIFMFSRSIYIRGIHGISFFQKPLGLGMDEFGTEMLVALKEDIIKGWTKFKQS